MIESKFTLFQMQGKSLLADAAKLGQARLGDGPEVLNAVDMIPAVSKLIISVFHSVMLLIAKVYQAVIGSEAISVNHRVRIDFIPDNREQNARRAIFNYLRIDLSATLDQTEDDVLATRASSSFTSYSSGSKIAFIDLNFARIKGALLLRILCNSLSDLANYFINSHSGNTSKSSNFCGLDIKRKEPDNLPEFGLRNS